MTEFICPQANVCTLYTDNAPECGTAFWHLPAQPAAGELCVNALANQTEFELNNPEEWKSWRRSYRAASAEVDIAMSLPPGDPAAEDHFEDARLLIDRALDEEGVNSETVLEATMLDIYLPAYKAARAGRILSSRHVIAQRRGLSNLVETIDARGDHPHVNAGLRNKLVLPMLMARSGVQFLPALARQAHNRIPGQPNHDGFVTHAERPVPVKVRGSKMRTEEYGTTVLFLPLSSLCGDSRPAELAVVAQGTAIVGETITLLQQETAGEHLGEVRTKWLNTLSRMVLAHVDEFAAKQ